LVSISQAFITASVNPSLVIACFEMIGDLSDYGESIAKSRLFNSPLP
jgi:hypothetical protein